jgi:SAM-dependent methyltransferase
MESRRRRTDLDRSQLSEGTPRYDGTSLETFYHAINWRKYWISLVGPYVSGDVAEIGAGLGANTLLIYRCGVRSILCIEPDEKLAARLDAKVCAIEGVTTSVGSIRNLSGHAFDSIVYIDVLEHVEDDKSELERACLLLRPSGRLIVLAPAHQALYSPFDRAIGHYRRYDRASLRSCAPQWLRLEKMAYLDSVGLLASAMNRFVLRQSAPTLQQILLWDRVMIPASTFLDRILLHRFGKSIMAVWTRD